MRAAGRDISRSVAPVMASGKPSQSPRTPCRGGVPHVMGEEHLCDEPLPIARRGKGGISRSRRQPDPPTHSVVSRTAGQRTGHTGQRTSCKTDHVNHWEHARLPRDPSLLRQRCRACLPSVQRRDRRPGGQGQFLPCTLGRRQMVSHAHDMDQAECRVDGVSLRMEHTEGQESGSCPRVGLVTAQVRGAAYDGAPLSRKPSRGLRRGQRGRAVGSRAGDASAG